MEMPVEEVPTGVTPASVTAKEEAGSRKNSRKIMPYKPINASKYVGVNNETTTKLKDLILRKSIAELSPENDEFIKALQKRNNFHKYVELFSTLTKPAKHPIPTSPPKPTSLTGGKRTKKRSKKTKKTRKH